jgi:hypothetical protein
MAAQKFSGLRFMALGPTAHLKFTKRAIGSGIRLVMKYRVIIGIIPQDDLMIKDRAIKWILYVLAGAGSVFGLRSVMLGW